MIELGNKKKVTNYNNQRIPIRIISVKKNEGRKWRCGGRHLVLGTCVTDTSA